MNVLQKIKRPLSLFMALVLLLSSMSYSTAANQPIEEGETNFQKYKTVFVGRSLYVFGKNHRSMNFYKAGPGSEAAPTFCIAPGKKLPGGTATRYKKYEAKPGETVPVIGSFERYLPMTIAYEWMIREGDYDNPVRYAVVQVYYWGCVAGHETDWAAQEAAMKKLAGVPETRQAMAYYQEMKEYILKGMEEYHSGANSGLPEWNGKQLIMEANEGSYTLTLDISQCPQLKETTWSFPDGNWSYQISPDGSKILFKYNGASKPSGTVTSGELSGVERRFYAYIFTPGGGYQEQMGRPDASHEPASVSFSVNSVPKTLTREPKLYRHSETFHSHYNVELEKYDAETNQPLEGTVFHVWEDFDAGQVNRNDYEEGSPDGETGQVYLNRMSPKPQASHIAGEITTDQEGRGAYRTERLYHYSKTYCMGHPAPDFLEAPEPAYNEQSGEQTNADEIQAVEADYPAVYDPASGALYVRKTARVTNGPSDEAGYWIRYEKGGYRLDAKTAAIKEKKEIDGPIPFPQAIEPLIQTVCQPVFETYAPGETLLDNQGKPIPELERVYTYAQREEEAEEERLVPVTASYDEEKGLYTFHEDDDTDWTAATQPKQRTYRAVTQEKAITHEGQEMPYNQYLTEIQGAGVSAYAALPKRDAGSYIKEAVLLYPGQREASQDGGTKERPITVLQRAIKQSIKITKDISQASYDGVNTYGALHNDPATALLKLFTGGRQTQGTKLLNQFNETTPDGYMVDSTGA